MKKYKRKMPLISPFKITVVALCMAIATAIIGTFLGSDNEWYVICGAIFVSLLIFDLFVVFGAGGYYRYSDKYIEVLYHLLPYKKMEYLWFNTVVISNASYDNGYGYGINRNILMQYRVKDNKAYTKLTFPFITLHTPQYPVNKIKPGMSSRELFMIKNNEIFCLGICWFDSLKELLKYTHCAIYVLEDVYLRYKDQFDAAFLAYKETTNHFFIIADGIIAYYKYQQKEKTN